MKDYKHVKVPRSYRTTNRRVATKRIRIGRGAVLRGDGIRSAMGTAAALLLTAALCFGGWAAYRWLTTAERFQIAGVDVRGVRAVSEDEIRELAGMFTGQNVFQVDLDAAARRALVNPWVRDVRVERSLPNRISMIIAERVPRAILQTASGMHYLDGDGVVMSPVTNEMRSGARLPSIAARGLRVEPRERTTADAVTAALDLVRELESRGGWDLGAVTVRADAPETITIEYADREFRIGSGNYDEKLKRLGEIAADMRRRGEDYSYVELRPERQAAVLVAKNVKERGNEGKRGGRTSR